MVTHGVVVVESLDSHRYCIVSESVSYFMRSCAHVVHRQSFSADVFPFVQTDRKIVVSGDFSCVCYPNDRSSVN